MSCTTCGGAASSHGYSASCIPRLPISQRDQLSRAILPHGLAVVDEEARLWIGDGATPGGVSAAGHDRGRYNLLQFGCAPLPPEDGRPTYDARAAMAAAMAIPGAIIEIPPGVFKCDSIENRHGTRLIGSGGDLTTLMIQPTSTAPSIWGLSDDMDFVGFTISVDPAPIGDHAGLYSTGLTIGRYFYADQYEPIRRFSIRDVKVLRNGRTENLVNSLTIIGDVADGEVIDCEATGGLGGLVIHWGADRIGAHGQPITTRTFHPHNIRVENFTVSDCHLWAVFISASYNVTVRNTTVHDCEMAVSVQAGDVGNIYASPDERGLINSGIHIDGVFGTTVIPTREPSGSPILWRASGRYVDKWNLTPFSGCSMDRVSLHCEGAAHDAGIVRLRDCRSGLGGIALGDILVTTDGSYSGPVFGFDDSSGFSARRLASNGRRGLALVACADFDVRADFSAPADIDLASEAAAISVLGARHTLTLATPLAIGEDELSFEDAGGTPVRLYPGDVLRSSSEPYPSVRVAAVAASGSSSVTIEPSRVALASGDYVYIDRQISGGRISGRVSGYPIGLLGASGTTRHIDGLSVSLDFSGCGWRDLAVANAAQLDIVGCNFRGGGTRHDGVETAAIWLERTGLFSIRDCRIGVDAHDYAHAVYMSGIHNHTGALIFNFFGEGFADHIGGSAPSVEYDEPDRRVHFFGNRVVGGRPIRVAAGGPPLASPPLFP